MKHVTITLTKQQRDILNPVLNTGIKYSNDTGTPHMLFGSFTGDEKSMSISAGCLPGDTGRSIIGIVRDKFLDLDL